MTIVSPCFAPDCEHPVTRPRHTVARRSRTLVLALTLAACGGRGGGASRDTYTRATDVQGDCCEKLTGDARAQCLQQVVRVDDAAVAKHAVTQETYACVVEHFVCDASTGRPTQPSAQAQLECIQDREAISAR